MALAAISSASFLDLIEEALIARLLARDFTEQ